MSVDQALRTSLGSTPGPWNTRPDLRDAAVLAPLFRRDGRDWLLFTKRRDDLPDHPGQISFPGGAREGDEDPLRCALRESEEEVGIDPESVEVLGRLGDRVSVARFLVAVFVGRIPEPVRLTPDPSEVDLLLEIPLDALLEEERWRMEDRTGPMGTFRRVPFFDWDGQTLWGLTGMFVRDLLELYREA
ncbi:MAG: NUDIX hydrolase [Planctomycetota bacterium]